MNVTVRGRRRAVRTVRFEARTNRVLLVEQRDLGAHLEELQSRERELAIELCRVRQDVLGIHTSIDRLLQHKPRIAQPAVVPQATPALKATSNLSAARPLPRAV